MVKPTIIIQARTGSKRFPKKVLAKIGNKPMIWYVIERMKKVRGIEQIVLATSRSKNDKILLGIARKCNVIGYEGDTHDVLNRYYQCAIKYDADPIIRITGDCPLIDPTLVEKMLKFYKENNFDYITNTFPPTFPDGLDVEILSFRTLEKIACKAKLSSDREHVTPYIRKHLDEFRIYNYENKKNLSNLRWTVDERKDLKLVKTIYTKLKPKLVFSMDRIMKIISKNPKISMINSDVNRNEGYFMSLEKDKIIK